MARVTVSLTLSEHGELRAVAARARVTLPWMIRQTVAEFHELERGDVGQLLLDYAGAGGGGILKGNTGGESPTSSEQRSRSGQ